MELIKTLWLLAGFVTWLITIFLMMEFNGLEVKNGKRDHAFTVFILGLLLLLPLSLIFWPFGLKDIVKLKKDCSQYDQQRK